MLIFVVISGCCFQTDSACGESKTPPWCSKSFCNLEYFQKACHISWKLAWCDISIMVPRIEAGPWGCKRDRLFTVTCLSLAASIFVNHHATVRMWPRLLGSDTEESQVQTVWRTGHRILCEILSQQLFPLSHALREHPSNAHENLGTCCPSS